MKPLVRDMVQSDPSKRPTIDEVVKRFDRVISTISWWKLHSRLVDLKEPHILSPIHHFFRRLIHIIYFRNPIPRPS